METDFQDQPGPVETVHHGNDNRRITLNHLVFLLILLISPGLALHRLSASAEAFLMLLGYWAGVSLFTFLLYARDKRRAGAGRERIDETALHLFELAGGWPGAFLAQRRLRHKSSKIRYQLVFWLIVLAHQYVATDYQLRWRLTHAVWDRIEAKFDPNL